MLRSTETIGANRYAQKGVVCTSGVQTVILGPVRVDPWFNKTFQVMNHGAAPLTVTVDVSLDCHGREAGVFVDGPGAAIDPNPSYWVTKATMSVQASGAQIATDTTPAIWARLTTIAPLSGMTVSGFLHALTM